MGEKLRLKWYDVHKYDEQTNHFNMKDRGRSYIFKGSQTMKEHLLGYDDSYESVGEYYMTWKYIKHVLGQVVNNEKVIKLMYTNNAELEDYTKRSCVDCIAIALEKGVQQLYPNNDVILKKYWQVVLQTIESLHHQVKQLKKNSKNKTSVLEPQQYDRQIERSRRFLSNLELRLSQKKHSTGPSSTRL